jgi:hypothetical protein
MGRHEAAASFDGIASEYLADQARELVTELDLFDAQPPEIRATYPLFVQEWAGRAVEILRELTRDA